MKKLRTAIRLPVGRSFAYPVFALTFSCGASATPPKTEADPAPPLSPTSSASEAKPEPAPSPELLAGIKAFDAGKFADARSSFEAAVKKAPSNYEALYDLGLACEKLGDKAAAESAYKAALASNPDLESASADLSALFIDEGRNDEAVAVARAGLAKHPNSGPLHENLGAALAASGDKDAATKELEQAAQLTPKDPMVHLTLAHWLNAWHSGGAAAHLYAASAVAKEDVGLLASIGFEYRMAGEFASCIETFDRAIALQDGGEVRTERALCKHGLKDEKGTLGDLRAAIAAQPEYAPAHFYLGGRLAMEKKFKEAAAEYGKYAQLAPNGSMARAAAERKKAAEDASKTRRP